MFEAEPTVITPIKQDETLATYAPIIKKSDGEIDWNQTAKEIDSQINCCTPYVAKLKQVNQQKYFLEFIENTLNNIKNLSFAIKNYLDYKKLMMATS